MVSNKSLDETVGLIAALLHDVSTSHGAVFNYRACKNTTSVVYKRVRAEGLGFLTKTLPRLGKAFDKALAANTNLNATSLCFPAMRGTELPRFLGEFFRQVLAPDGSLLPQPCAHSVRIIRQLCYLFYKYELPYSHEQEQDVLTKFERTDEAVLIHSKECEQILSGLAPEVSEMPPSANHPTYRRRIKTASRSDLAREARILLSRVFAFFDPTDIYPRHGPGVVSTKEKLWGKYLWTNVSERITNVYPLDAYFYASLGHVCDDYDRFNSITSKDLPARVILVPKDSRGPRLISCEPVDFQWIQQGLGRAIVEHVESHELTKFNVHFTDQQPNRFGALLGSETGRYSTLDLNEASDRVSVGLVHLLFPSHVYTYLEACRSSSTVLPDGRVIRLNKYAPMGSSLCFPVLALCVWAILTAGAPDADTREGILVYGDDVIVPRDYTRDAIEQLESFGLKINQDKSCSSGLFRESCGMDAFNGVDVTPVRLRTVWTSSPSPESYSSWIAYANSFYDKKYYTVYDKIVEQLLSIYGPIPDDSMHCACPRLRIVPDSSSQIRRRFNKSLQKLEYRVWDIASPRLIKHIAGWGMLLRYFAEVANTPNRIRAREDKHGMVNKYKPVEHAFSVSSYTSPRTSMLVRRWR